jgi:undecaprenyl diphosphate synthase
MKQKQTIFERFPVLKKIPKERFPKHVFIIPDGNGRWAKKNGNPVLYGHKKGAQIIRTLLEDLSEIEEIKIVSIWGFSADNWKREKKEVEGLMYLFKDNLKKTLTEIKKRNGRFVHLGRKDRIPSFLLKTIEKTEGETKQNTKQIVCIAIDFGGQDEEIRVMEKARAIPQNTPMTAELLWSLRDGKGVITPADLLIRTSGEIRTSDVGWLNGAPTELYFLDKYFPDITTEDVIAAIVDFSKRERRFGGRLQK